MTPARCPPLAEWCHLPSPGHHPLDGLSVYPPPAPPFQFVSTAPGGWAGAEHSGWDPCSATPISPQTSYSVLRRLAFRPKTQFTPLPSASRVQQVREGRGGGCHRPGLGEEGTRGGAGGGWVQGESQPLLSQARWLSGLSPQPCPEEPAVPWVSIRNPPGLGFLCPVG